MVNNRWQKGAKETSVNDGIACVCGVPRMRNIYAKAIAMRRGARNAGEQRNSKGRGGKEAVAWHDADRSYGGGAAGE